MIDRLVFGFLVSMVTLRHEVPRCTGDYLIRITVRIILASFGVLAGFLLAYLFFLKQVGTWNWYFVKLPWELLITGSYLNIFN